MKSSKIQFWILTCILLAVCGRGGGGGGSTNNPVPLDLSSIAVTPVNPIIGIGVNK